MAQTDSTLFKGKITNKKYDVYMNIDFYHKNLKVPGQELFGEMPDISVTDVIVANG